MPLPAFAGQDVGLAASAVPATMAAEVVDSGEIGTCYWTVDADGLLSIAPQDGVEGAFKNHEEAS